MSTMAIASFTDTIRKYFEEEIEIALAFFVPLLVDTDGNTGTQVVVITLLFMPLLLQPFLFHLLQHLLPKQD